jgi:hypothetical protein
MDVLALRNIGLDSFVGQRSGCKFIFLGEEFIVDGLDEQEGKGDDARK